MRLALPFVAALSIACAKSQQVTPIAQLSPERVERCRTVADSVFANSLPEQLPQAGPVKSRVPRLSMRVPMSVPPGMPVRANFVVRPDGSGDTATVVITGTDDAKFRRDAMALVSRVILAPAEIDGCPVWSQTTIISVRGPVMRGPSDGGPPRIHTP